MDSKLLLSWAKASQWSVEMDEYGCGIPGMHMARKTAALDSSLLESVSKQLLLGSRLEPIRVDPALPDSHAVSRHGILDACCRAA